MQVAVVQGPIIYHRRRVSKYGPAFRSMIEVLRSNEDLGQLRNLPRTANWRHGTIKRWKAGLKEHAKYHVAEYAGYRLSLRASIEHGICFQWVKRTPVAPL